MRFKKFKNKQTIIVKHSFKNTPFVQVRNDNGFIEDAQITVLDEKTIEINLREKMNGTVVLTETINLLKQNK